MKENSPNLLYKENRTVPRQVDMTHLYKMPLTKKNRLAQSIFPSPAGCATEERRSTEIGAPRFLGTGCSTKILCATGAGALSRHASLRP